MDLSCVGFAGGNDAKCVWARGVSQHEHPGVDAAEQLEAVFTVGVAKVGADQPVGVEEGLRGIGEVETPLCKTAFALGFIPFEIQAEL